VTREIFLKTEEDIGPTAWRRRRRRRRRRRSGRKENDTWNGKYINGLAKMN
jgi:hypothetical protein